MNVPGPEPVQALNKGVGRLTAISSANPPATVLGALAGESPAMTVRDQLSRKLRSFLERLGCFSLRSALASIWRMRSRVTENCWPTSSRV